MSYMTASEYLSHEATQHSHEATRRCWYIRFKSLHCSPEPGIVWVGEVTDALLKHRRDDNILHGNCDIFGAWEISLDAALRFWKRAEARRLDVRRAVDVNGDAHETRGD